jgi:hypothetical protein
MGAISIALPALLLLIAALPVMRHPRLLRSRAAGLLAAPLPLGIATLVAIALLAGWPASLFPRYVNPMLPLFALFAAWAWTRARVRRKSLLWLASLSSLTVSLIWVIHGGRLLLHQRRRKAWNPCSTERN